MDEVIEIEEEDDEAVEKPTATADTAPALVEMESDGGVAASGEAAGAAAVGNGGGGGGEEDAAAAAAEGGEEEAEVEVSEEELNELQLRAPAGFTAEELRYMLGRSVADCAAALPEITASMAQVAPVAPAWERARSG